MRVVRQVCVSGGKQRLVKTFTSWQVLASLENTGWCRRWSGAGGSSFPRISAGQRRYFDFRITVSVELATLDNSYIKCYNKCNDDNKNVISHQTVKFAL